MPLKRILVMETTEHVYHGLKTQWPRWSTSAPVLDHVSYALSEIPPVHYDAVVIDLSIFENSLPRLFALIGGLSLNTKVIVAVDESFEEENLVAQRGRGMHFITKPVDPSELLELLSEVVDAQAQEDAHGYFFRAVAELCDLLERQAVVMKCLSDKYTVFLQQMVNRPAEVETHSVVIDKHAQLVKFSLTSLVEALSKDGIAENYAAQLGALDSLLSYSGVGGGQGETPFKDLSLRELRIIEMIEAGWTTEKIAELLHISPDTVKTHRRNIRRKLDLVGEKDDLASYLRSLQGKDESDTSPAKTGS